jgi:peptide/nickel transport system substrate-binding protein
VPDDPSSKQINRRQLMQGAAAIAATGSTAGLLAACGAGGGRSAKALQTGIAPAGVATTIAEATFAFPATAENLDFLRSTAHPAIMSNANGGPLRFDAQGRIHPNLAEKWSQPDAKSYLYSLRDGLRFSDGSPLTAHDVAFTWNRVRDPRFSSPYGGQFAGVKSVQAVNDREVLVQLDQPNALFANIPAHIAGWIAPKAYVEKKGHQLGSSSALPVGAGAYRMTSFIPDQVLTFERNPYYWGPKPPLERLKLQFLPDNSARLLALRSGQVDGTLQVPLEDIRVWNNTPGVSLISVPGAGLGQIYFNVGLAPFDDIHVRRAWLHCYDATAIATDLLAGFAVPAVNNALVPPLFWASLGLNSGEVESLYRKSLPNIDYSISAAKSELAQSKVPHGFSATAQYGESQQRVGKALLVLKQALSQIGVQLNVQQVSTAKQNENFGQHTGSLVCGVGFGDYPDPFDIYYINFDSKFAAPNNYNDANYKNPRVDAINKAYLATPLAHTRQRISLATQAAKAIQDDVPAIMLWWEQEVAAVGKRITLQDFSGWYLFQPWAANVRARA